MAARDGYARLTIEGIAKEACVGKQTIYRWWPGKAEIILEALTHEARAADLHKPTNNWRADLEMFTAQVIRRVNTPNGMIVKSMLAEAALDATFARKFRADYLNHRIEQAASIIRRRPGTSDAQAKQAVELIYGLLWYRLIAGWPLRRGLAKQLVDAVDGALTPR